MTTPPTLKYLIDNLGWANLANESQVIFRRISEAITTFLMDAPIDGSTYGRKDGEWKEVTGGGSQNLAETLAVDNKTNDIPIVSNNGLAVVDVNDGYSNIGYDNNYLFLEPTTGMLLHSDVGVFTTAPEMTAIIAGTISYACPSFLLNSEEVATQPWVTSQGYGTGTVTSVTGVGGETTVATGTTTPVIGISSTYTSARDAYADAKVANDLTASTTVAPSKTAVNTALALKQDIPFEIQITQTSTSAPTIVSGSEKGLRGATLTTSYINIGEYNIISDLPIFADAKDFHKNSVWVDIRIIGQLEAGFPISVWAYKVLDDYTLQIVTVEDFFLFTLTDGVLIQPQQLKIEYKN